MYNNQYQNQYPFQNFPNYYNNGFNNLGGIAGNIGGNNPINIQGNTFGLTGRVVNSLEEISANDVPMTSDAYFPRADKREIYIKSWNPNGTINTSTYRLVEMPGNNINPANNDIRVDITNILQNIQTDLLDLKNDIASIKNKKEKRQIKDDNESDHNADDK